MRNKLIVACLLVLVLVTTGAMAACAPEAPAVKPIKIGLIRGFTGAVAAIGEELARGADLVFQENNYEVAGRPIVVIEEDEGDTPEQAVSRAKKLVEQDNVDVIMGPLLAHSLMGVQEYLKPKGVPHLSFGPSDTAASEHTFFSYSTGRGGAVPGGSWAYDALGARKATFIYTDYLFSHQLRDGFTEGFTGKGGTIIGDIAVPWPEMDMAPYLTQISADTDVLVVFMVPACAAFIQQYREFGLTVPVFFMSALMYEDPLLAVLGDAAVGMYGTTFYSSDINTAENNAFVAGFRDKFTYYPSFGTVQGYWPALRYIEALKATGGDTDMAKVDAALLAAGTITTPAGPLQVTAERVTVQNFYVMQVVKTADGRYTWKTLETYTGVGPR